MVYEHFRDPSMNAQGFNYNGVAPADYYDWREQTHGFEDMAAWRWWQFNLTGERGELPELVSAARRKLEPVSAPRGSCGFGRTFTESEDRPDGNAVMLTWSLFERRFAGDAFDCRQADSSRRKAIHGRRRAPEVVHVSRCKDAGLGSICIRHASRLAATS